MFYHKRYAHVFTAVFLLVLSVLLPGKNTKRADILIVSPHPDDAVLCCAGLIQQMLEQGKRVHIVELTDGDGYTEAAALLADKPASLLTPNDYRRLGYVRKHEDIRAMSLLGIPRRRITFLGYPDGWLNEVYDSIAEVPFTSPFTGVSRSRYNSLFTRQFVIADIARLINNVHPEHIYVSGPTDSALDHQIAYRFVHEAIRTSNYTGKLFTYTNHATESAAAEPVFTVSLTGNQARNKSEAIESYATQLALDGEYLRTFTRNEENFY